MLSGLVVLAQLAIIAHAPDSVLACDAIEVSVAVSAPRASLPRLVVPAFAPFDVLRGSEVPRLELTPNATLAEYRFTLTTNRTGRFVLPPFQAILGQQRVASRPLPISVRPTLGRSLPAVVARARIDTAAVMDLRMRDAADTVYVGQQATYEVAVFLNQAAREKLRRNPTFYPPEMQAMLAYDLPAPGPGRTRSGSPCFDALVYRRALFPLTAGRLVIPPAQLVYSTSLSPNSLLSREESHELQTDSVVIVAIEPPPADRPPEYIGAVGQLRLESELDSVSARVGDPMLLTVRVLGTGNVKLFPRPAIEVPWAALVPADERVRVDSNETHIRGAKEFDWVLTPRIAGEFDVPPVRYGYFDPGQRRYETAATDARRVRIASGALASADTGRIEPPLTIRTRYRGPVSAPPQSHPAFWLVMALAPLPALAGRWRRRAVPRRRAVARDPAGALATSGVRDPVDVRRHFVRQLAHRVGCNPEDFTHPGALERALRRAGVGEPTAVRAEQLLRELDAAAYSGHDTSATRVRHDATSIVRAVDAEALARSELPFWIPVVVLGLCVGATVSLTAADTASTHFARGVSAYLRQNYPAARTAFAGALAIEPASSDAWANYGTASWGASDTAAAILGWRQTLAIEPDADDLQDRMSLVRQETPMTPGWVPAVPRNFSVWLFATLWILAWALAWLDRSSALEAWRASAPWIRRVPLPLAVSAIVIGLLSIELETRTAGSRLAVIRHAVTLVSDPAIGMDRGPLVGTGEIVRIVGRRGAWTRVEAAADRDGWIPSRELLTLAEHRTPRD